MKTSSGSLTHGKEGLAGYLLGSLAMKIFTCLSDLLQVLFMSLWLSEF